LVAGTVAAQSVPPPAADPHDPVGLRLHANGRDHRIAARAGRIFALLIRKSPGE